MDELASAFDDAQVQYAFLRIEKTDDGGDSKRVKFVSVTWVGENAPAMKKGKVMNHKGDVLALFKVRLDCGSTPSFVRSFVRSIDRCMQRANKNLTYFDVHTTQNN